MNNNSFVHLFTFSKTQLYILLAAFASTLPASFIKQYTKKPNNIWIFLSILSYLILIFTYIYLFKNKEISTIYPIIKICSIIMVICFGVLYLGETFTTTNFIGIILGITSIYLLSL